MPLAGASTLRDRAHLYAEADEITARWLGGDAAGVRAAVDGPISEALAAGLPDVATRLRYVAALADLDLGRTSAALAACDGMLDHPDDDEDPAWASAARALRGLLTRGAGDEAGAVEDLIEAAVLLDEARPTGYAYLHAVGTYARGCAAMRWYELALGALDRAATLVSRTGIAVLRGSHLADRLLVETHWALELERVGDRTGAQAHFSAALDVDAELDLLPALRTRLWLARRGAVTHLCRAALDATPVTADSEPAAVADQSADSPDARLTLVTDARRRLAGRASGSAHAAPDQPTADQPTAGPSIDQVLRTLGDDWPVERTFALLARTRWAAARGDVAAAHADVQAAAASAAAARDDRLAVAVAWELARLPDPDARTELADGPDLEPIDDYVGRLELERADERVGFTRETEDRVRAEVEQRAATRRSSAYLTDAITGAANRRHLELRLPEIVARAADRTDSIALAFVDLDPATPTSVLADVAAGLSSRLPGDAFVARYGGTELAVVCPARTTRQLAGDVAAVLAERDAEKAGRARTGIASLSAGASVAGLVASADEALMAARRAGGGIQLAVGLAR